MSKLIEIGFFGGFYLIKFYRSNISVGGHIWFEREFFSLSNGVIYKQIHSDLTAVQTKNRSFFYTSFILRNRGIF